MKDVVAANESRTQAPYTSVRNLREDVMVYTQSGIPQDGKPKTL